MKFSIKDIYIWPNPPIYWRNPWWKTSILYNKSFQFNYNPRAMSFSHGFDDITSNLSLGKNCPNAEFSWAVSSRIWTDTEIYGVNLRIQS